MANDTNNFEVLLHRPSKNFTSDWQRPINRYLEDYLHHCCSLQNINFSEAAIILANISDVYKKRIDLLYDEFLKFIAYMNDIEARKEETAVPNQKTTKKPKRGINAFQNEAVEILKIIDNEHTTTVNFDNINKIGERKKVILNHFIKVPIKVGTVCQVYDVAGKELGYKDEFRLFWPISSNGLASEYFDYRNQNLERISGQLLEDSIDDNDDCIMNHEPCDDSMEDRVVDQPPSINESVNPEPVQPNSPSSPPPLPSQEFSKSKKNEKTKKVIDVWETISFNFVFPLRILSVKSVFSLPKYLKEEGTDEHTKRKRNGEIKENYNDKCATVGELFYQNEILNDNSIGLKLKSKLAKKHRKALVLSELKTEMKDDHDELVNFHAEDDNDNHEDDYDVPFDESVNVSGPVDLAADKDYVGNALNYLNTAVEVLTVYQNDKKEMSEKTNEIAKKVAQWHESIMPALEAAESRSIFNVNEYGTKVLNNFPDNDKQSNIVQFHQLVKNQPREEICRFLLASLMLANTYNVEIIKSNNQELAKDCLELRLLNKVRHQDVLNENMEATTADSRS